MSCPQRREAWPVKIGNVTIGSSYPVAVQSMTSTSTMDTPASVAQIKRIVDAGGEIVRLTAQGVREAENLGEIRQELRRSGYDVPLVADIHFNPKAAFAAASRVEKVRINPGNFVDPGRVFKKIEFTDEEYADELAKIETDFRNVAISIKASNVVVMTTTVRLLVAAMDAEDMHFPLHLGVTEAGDAEDGRIKSAVGIGSLLADGIGDTIRVSLSEEPECEIPVARLILNHISQMGESEGLTPVDCSGRPTPVVTGYDPEPADMVMISGEGASLSRDLGRKLMEIGTGDGRRVILHATYPAGMSAEELTVAASIDLGRLLLAGYGDGVQIDCDGMDRKWLSDLALGILQATRRRISRTEFISCPGCGRTLYDLQSTLKDIKGATAHLKGLKIGVMGCIVNGPGEMADADYGYVGAGVGKISLYKGKECIVKNIPAEEAIPRLIALIKENGDWIDPA
ncbi:MAG: flavodoxin-dependent (E)-4-hydroxy-3-methylbut-2-enyl-diphosphate synthase [Muribaculaceae bacterium]|nr:flavodoxin-dependent (E)-4-hydroxy-3-methylbut-2-enyl-diphosphate synthase [Muribaculaceae bacterium]